MRGGGEDRRPKNAVIQSLTGSVRNASPVSCHTTGRSVTCRGGVACQGVVLSAAPAGLWVIGRCVGGKSGKLLASTVFAIFGDFSSPNGEESVENLVGSTDDDGFV